MDAVFKCPLCFTEHASADAMERCAKMGVRDDRGVKVGDTVRITTGDEAGQYARVTRCFITTPDYGMRMSRRYVHTIALDAELTNGGMRTLLFTDYEVLDVFTQS